MLDFFVPPITIQVIFPQSEMHIEGFCHIKPGTSQQGTLLLEAETLLPFTKRMTGQGEHFKRTGDGIGVVEAFSYSQTLLSSIVNASASSGTSVSGCV